MPENDNLTSDFDKLVIPNRTWNIDFERNVVTTNVTDLNAVKQAALLILNTERYEYPIYSHQYGVELMDLFGENQHYAMSEIKRRITEALMQDDRISGVDGFEYSRTKRGLHVSFTVTCNSGKFSAETEVVM